MSIYFLTFDICNLHESVKICTRQEEWGWVMAVDANTCPAWSICMLYCDLDLSSYVRWLPPGATKTHHGYEWIGAGLWADLLITQVHNSAQVWDIYKFYHPISISLKKPPASLMNFISEQIFRFKEFKFPAWVKSLTLSWQKKQSQLKNTHSEFLCRVTDWGRPFLMETLKPARKGSNNRDCHFNP
jgi:hypothetical protein